MKKVDISPTLLPPKELWKHIKSLQISINTFCDHKQKKVDYLLTKELKPQTKKELQNDYDLIQLMRMHMECTTAIIQKLYSIHADTQTLVQSALLDAETYQKLLHDKLKNEKCENENT